MAEIQRSSGNQSEVTARFIDMIMMNAQQALLYLGKIPHPQTGRAEVNVEVGRIFIDQMEIIEIKTRGNLNADEKSALNQALQTCKLAFVEVAGVGARESLNEDSESEAPLQATSTLESKGPQESVPPVKTAFAAPSKIDPSPSDAQEHKKKFSKSYG
ncbi:MAG: DUF1844 domain-containing protein [Verrucomicrobiota bacterium]|nr:DUF1844 domain-containing protein [Verrucomicrobiota bacterium]